MEKKEDITKKENKDISALDKVAKSILSLVDTGYSERTRLSSQNDKFQSIIDRELDISKGVSQNNIVDFIMSLNMGDKSAAKSKQPSELTDTSTIFTKDIGDIYNYFQDMYKNRYIEMTDLKFISKFIPALGEAVKTTLDAIVSSDDVSSTISRTIFLSPNTSEEHKTQILNEVDRLEKELKLLKRLKNIVYKNTLVTGKYYIYAVPYKDLFEEYSKNKNKNTNKFAPYTSHQQSDFNLKGVSESNTESLDITPAIESVINFIKGSPENIKSNELENLKKVMQDTLPSIYLSDDTYLSYALEETSAVSNMSADKNFNGKSFSDITFNNISTPDGTMDINTKGKLETFDINGTYVRYIESKNIVPIKIFDRIVGYYHINVSNKKKSSSRTTEGLVSVNSTMFNTVTMTEKRKDEAISSIVNSIADGILQKFNLKFVRDNPQYKQMIADCILSHGIVDNDYSIQFIPAEHIVEFVINEDEKGNGESILSDSLFPAKLLLSLIICKMLNYMNKSGNKNLAHVYKNSIDTSSANQLNRVIRMMQESNITFNDLLSTNMVFSKFTRDSNIALPTAKNGNKLVEMETIEGQQIDLKTDFEEKLEQMAILGTGVPSVILEYVNQVDFAKQIVSANIKFAGRVSSLDSDLEEPTTQLYRILIENSSLPVDAKNAAKTMLFKLPRPKALSNVNGTDFLQNITSMANLIADTLMGQNQNNDEKVQSVKEMVVKEIVKSNTPFLDWGSIEELYHQAQIEVSKLKEKEKTNE
jgi:hypothetical protein